ncbi:MAG: methyltransferase domain-containing protein [Candidatus Omnitrophota bacterium]|nr:methyltransferase domain-containing protein [Candidatus Omnitrophota bacterium]
MSSKEDTKETVKAYYGKVLQSKKDLKTNACCSVDSLPQALKSIFKQIEPKILDKFYGCGSPIPPFLKDCTVLDLGCGTGRDVYLVSVLIGENGMSIGVDMTDEQLEVARKYKDAQMKRFGFKKCNVDFKKGYIEDLKEIGIADNSVDVVISNCVINLSPDKKSVFSEIFRVLKPGGELYFSDVFSDRRVPEYIKNDPVFYGECMGGSMYIEDFRRMIRKIGCLDYRVMSKRKITIDDPQMLSKAGDITFYSMTLRAFKLDDLEDLCEDFGQVAYYQGTIPYYPHQFQLDDHHVFISHKPMLICGNTASMLSNTRFGKHFKIIGDTSRHFGPFPCGPVKRVSDVTDNVGGSCC